MSKVYALGLGIVLILTPGMVRAGEQKPDVAANVEVPAAAVVDEPGKPVEVGNKICPVSHEEVGKEGMAPFKVTYKGKVYNLCCGMCERDFNKDPEEYARLMDDEVAQAKAAEPQPAAAK